MRLLRESFQIIRAHRRAYVVMNVIAFGCCLLGFGAAMLFPELNASRINSLEDDGSIGLVLSVLSNPALFALLIFAVNVFTVGVASILLPSMVVPFVGIAVFAYRALIIGMTLAPADRNAAIGLIPHSLTLVIEFQAYILLMLGAYLLGKSWLTPASVAAQTRRQGYLHGLRQIGRLSLPALVLFVIGAVYEALSLVFLVPQLIRVWP